MCLGLFTGKFLMLANRITLPKVIKQVRTYILPGCHRIFAQAVRREPARYFDSWQGGVDCCGAHDLYTTASAHHFMKYLCCLSICSTLLQSVFVIAVSSVRAYCISLQYLLMFVYTNIEKDSFNTHSLLSMPHEFDVVQLVVGFLPE